MSSPIEGWYADPAAPGLLRWWDGANWTSQTQLAVPHPPPAGSPVIAASAQPLTPRDATPVARSNRRDLQSARRERGSTKTRHENFVRTITEIPVDVDERALMLRGWTVKEVRARVTTDYYDNGDRVHSMDLFGTALFDPEGWTEAFRFSREFPTSVVATVQCPDLSEFDTSAALFYVARKDAMRPVRFKRMLFIDTNKSLDHDEVLITLRAFDAFEGISWQLPIDPAPLRVDYYDESSYAAVRLRIEAADILMFRTESDDTTCGVIRLSGSVEISDLNGIWNMYREQNGPFEENDTPKSEAPFDVSVPKIIVEFFDATGFLVGQQEILLDLDVPVSAECRLPSREATWLVDEEFAPTEFVAIPVSAVVRIEDRT